MKKFILLLIGHTEEMHRELVEWFEGDDFHVMASDSVKAVAGFIRRGEVDLVMSGPGVSPDDLSQLVEAVNVSWPQSSIALAMDPSWRAEDLRLKQPGVNYFFEMPLSKEAVADFISKVIDKRMLIRECGIVGHSEAIKSVMETVIQVAQTNVSILITGETGTGKELVAKAIHQLSPRRENPFIPINCAAIPESLIESELFGHEKGAFTGAISRRKGAFEMSHGGTILLDEIGDMPLVTQVKILRALEDKEIRRVGGSETIKVDIRVLASTNIDLQKAVDEGNFRRDLYYRLKVVEIKIPPLRERRGDIPLLLNTFIEKYGKKHKVQFSGFSEGAMDTLVNYSWPGNVRELENLVESVVVLSKKGKIASEDIIGYLDERIREERNLPAWSGDMSEIFNMEFLYRTLLSLKMDMDEMKNMLRGIIADRGKEVRQPVYRTAYTDYTEEVLPDSPEESNGEKLKTMAEAERDAIEETLRRVGGNRKKAAEALGIGERTLYRKLRDYNTQ